MDKRDFVSFVLMNVKHCVIHRPRIGESVKPNKERIEPIKLGMTTAVHLFFEGLFTNQIIVTGLFLVRGQLELYHMYSYNSNLRGEDIRITLQLQFQTLSSRN